MGKSRKQKHGEAKPQTRPTLVTLFERFSAGLDVLQEYGRRRRTDPPQDQSDPAEWAAFVALEDAYLFDLPPEGYKWLDYAHKSFERIKPESKKQTPKHKSKKVRRAERKKNV